MTTSSPLLPIPKLELLPESLPVTPLKFRCEDISAQVSVHFDLDLELLYGTMMTQTIKPHFKGFPSGMPEWMKRIDWGCTRLQELYRGRGIELIVTSNDPDLRDEHDTPRFSVSWGVVYAKDKKEEELQLEKDEYIGCAGVYNTEDWKEALAIIAEHSAS